MKSILVFAIFATIAFANLSTKEIHFSLAEVQKDTFGSTVLNAVQMNLYSKAPADEIIALVDQILSQLADSQEQSDQAHEVKKSAHASDVEQLTDRLNETKNIIESSEKSIELNQENLESSKASLVQAQSDYDNTVNSIEVGTAERADSHQRWSDSDAELTEALASVDEATKLIQHMLNGVSFVQVKSRFEKVFDKLKSNKSKQASLFRPLVMALSQISNKLDFENVQRILNLLNSLRQSLADVQNNNKEDESRAAKQWEDDLNLLLQHKQRYTEQIEQLKTLINNLSSSIQRETVSLENSRLTLETIEAGLKNAEAQWVKDQEDYNSATAERERETAILKKLNNLLVTKFGAVQEFLQIL